jgi:hypothetical protein
LTAVAVHTPVPARESVKTPSGLAPIGGELEKPPAEITCRGCFLFFFPFFFRFFGAGQAADDAETAPSIATAAAAVPVTPTAALIPLMQSAWAVRVCGSSAPLLALLTVQLPEAVRMFTNGDASPPGVV